MRAANLIAKLKEKNWTIATAESCTGGLLAAALTAVPGASDVFGYGFTTYSNEAKMCILGVPEATIERFTAVSEQTAHAMISGLLAITNADVALVTTGIAGPSGGSAEQPVGLVYIGCGGNGKLWVSRYQFSGDREMIRQKTVETALHMAETLLEQKAPEEEEAK